MATLSLLLCFHSSKENKLFFVYAFGCRRVSYRIVLSLYGLRFCFLLLVRHCVFCFNLSWLKTRSSDTRLALSAASLPLPSYYYNIYIHIHFVGFVVALLRPFVVFLLSLIKMTMFGFDR